MNEPGHFIPARRDGLIFQAAGILLLGGGSGGCFWLAMQARVGGLFLVYLLGGLALFAPLPLLIYGAYSLLRADYTLERDGLRLRWGLRSEDVPLPQIEWVRPATDLATSLPLPWLRWPGVLIGVRNVEGLGPVEYLASGTQGLLLVATPQRIFAISPSDSGRFMRTFTRINELGSLMPLASRSVYPVFLLARVWEKPLARALLLAGLGLGVILLVWVGLVVPTRQTISLGFAPSGLPLDPGPSAALLLLPVLDAMAYLVDLLGGLYFFRKPEYQQVAYLLWAGGVVTPLTMLLAVLFILE